MQTPPRFISPIAAFLARRAHLIALALFAAVGLATFGDYGVVHDERMERRTGLASFNYILGDSDALLADDDHNRFYGVVFQIPLIAVERAFGLANDRLYLMRRPVSRAFFLICGFFAWLLAYRMFGNRIVALFAMLVFLLHPRIYAHSFYNPKDAVFLGAFMVSLYLIHRAFRRDSVWAFALCGAGVGLTTNIRIMGVTLFAAVLGMLALDAFRALRRGNGGIKRVLANAAAFSFAAILTLYATLPVLWRAPLDFIDAFPTLARHPSHLPTLFRGEWVSWPDIPWDYIPAWILITTPPAFLALFALGAAVAVWLCAVRWRDALRNSDVRFGLLALACAVLPVAAAIALNSNLYNSWRQMFFLYAPLCVLAAFGMSRLSALRNPRFRAAAFALAALGLAISAVQIALLHPYQSAYFSALANKETLAERWHAAYYTIGYTEALRVLTDEFPNRDVRIEESVLNKDILAGTLLLPKEVKSRARFAKSFPDFRIEHLGDGEGAFWKRTVYGVPIVSIADMRAESESAARAAYARSQSLDPAASAGGFNIYRDVDAILYVKESCGERDADIDATFRISIFRDAPDGAPRRSTTSPFSRYGAAFDGKCLLSYPLPEGSVGSAKTARIADDGEGELWSVVIRFPENAVHKAALAALPAEPSARSDFDLYANGDSLVYVKSPCAESDARGRFFLSVFPVDLADLPKDRRDGGFEHDALNFDFAEYGEIFDGECAILRDLPDYPIAAIETGQFVPGEGELWKARIAVGE